MIKKAQAVLRSVFGYDDFISLQRDIIENVLQKNDSLVLMPTGGGKSLCYQIPALVFEGLTIVVSPLISLMKDQTSQLKEAGAPAVFLNSSLSSEAYRRNMADIRKGAVKLLYVAPETLLKSGMSEFLTSIRVDLLAIDEAHCISMWGHDFRPEYRQIADFRRQLPEAACIALTATATPRVRADIKSSLGIHDAGEYVASFNRKNLLLRVVEKNNALRQAIAFLKRFPGESGIVYCYTRKQVESLCESLVAAGFSARPYHAGLNEADRNRHQDLFINDDVRIIVATIAFGMGIDKSNVRFVVHYDMPKSIDNYYQEIGRAGRDGMPAECLLLFSYGDIHKIRYHTVSLPESEKRVANIQLQALLRLMEADGCRRKPLLDYFGETFPDTECGMCDNCLSEKRERVDLTVAAQKFLSCIKRTGEIFGATHIIDVLRGSTARKVLQARHDTLSTYGIGKEYSRHQWLALCRQFLHQDLISQDMEYGGLRLTPKAWEVFRGELKVQGLIPEDRSQEMPEQIKKTIDTGPVDTELFNRLRLERKTLADAAGLPPYVVFSDKTLSQMASLFPQTEESLLGLHGVGEVKLEKYGQSFLDIICRYCREHQIEDRVPVSVVKSEPKAKAPAQPKRFMVIGDAVNDGRTMDSLMEEYDIKRETILAHLYSYVQAGYALDARPVLTMSLLSRELRDEVIGRFRELGTDRLKPVFETLGGRVEYSELRVLALYVLAGGVDEVDGMD
jgi:ATP-dependent DNA helicase RecQ